MSKSDLQARPVYHRKRDSIEAHLTIVFAALAVSRWIEARTGSSIRKFVKTARRYRTIEIQAGRQTIMAADPFPATSAEPSKPSTATAARVIDLLRWRESCWNRVVRITAGTVADGIREQLFTIGDIPGVLWTPAGGSGPRPLVLIGHGGGQHKKEPGVLSRAFPYVTSCGFAVAAIDAPGAGDRPGHPQINRLVAEIQGRLAEGEPAGPAWPALSETVAAQLIPDWQATLDALQELDSVGDNLPVGYYGLSQGGDMGIRLVAAEPRITAAVLGLTGSEWLAGTAARITIPVEFVLQWDDEGHPRDSVMKLFDALGSTEKTLHANPGAHQEVPSFEIDSSVRFFARHLATPSRS